jgi:hypothetical protein
MPSIKIGLHDEGENWQLLLIVANEVYPRLRDCCEIVAVGA